MLSKATDTNCVGKLNPQPTWKFQKVPKLDAVQPRDKRNACSSANQWRQSWTLICCHTIRSWCATDPACVGVCMAIVVGTCWYCIYFGDGSGKRSWNEFGFERILSLQFACFNALELFLLAWVGRSGAAGRATGGISGGECEALWNNSRVMEVIWIWLEQFETHGILVSTCI